MRPCFRLYTELLEANLSKVLILISRHYCSYL
uniref:Uncharacterized protein n=1 Tax=Anguilla anguilla TaxID=7936 RepID=A0A0E9UN55_ANGAN